MGKGWKPRKPDVLSAWLVSFCVWSLAHEEIFLEFFVADDACYYNGADSWRLRALTGVAADWSECLGHAFLIFHNL